MGQANTKQIHNLERCAGLPIGNLNWQAAHVPHSIQPVIDNSQLGLLNDCQIFKVTGITLATAGSSFLSQATNIDSVLCEYILDSYCYSGSMEITTAGANTILLTPILIHWEQGYAVALDKPISVDTTIAPTNIGYTFNILLPPLWDLALSFTAFGGAPQFNFNWAAKLLRKDNY